MRAKCPFCDKTIIIPSASETLVEENKKLLEEIEKLKNELEEFNKKNIGPVIDEIEEKKEKENDIPHDFLKKDDNTVPQSKVDTTTTNTPVSEGFSFFRRFNKNTSVGSPIDGEKLVSEKNNKDDHAFNNNEENIEKSIEEEFVEKATVEETIKEEPVMEEIKKDAYGISDVPVII